MNALSCVWNTRRARAVYGAEWSPCITLLLSVLCTPIGFLTCLSYTIRSTSGRGIGDRVLGGDVRAIPADAVERMNAMNVNHLLGSGVPEQNGGTSDGDGDGGRCRKAHPRDAMEIAKRRVLVESFGVLFGLFENMRRFRGVLCFCHEISDLRSEDDCRVFVDRKRFR
ncbi:hypothetical protein BJX96DRAFT_152285 [Aspergillus floccosus]